MKTITYILIGIAILIGGIAFYMIVPVYFDYRHTKLAISEIERSLAEQRQEALTLRREITALKEDSKAIERVAREKFGWCREGEKIYHFDAPVGLGPTPATSPPATLDSP